jgi:DNA repair exonuclease SbcCD ATPase subunit
MAEINGGSLKYTAELDVAALKKAAQEGNVSLSKMSQTATETGQSIDNAFDATTENIKIQKQVILDLENQYKELQKQISSVAPGRTQLGLMNDAADIAKEIELEKKALIELEGFVKSNKETHDSLRQKLTAVKNEMQSLVVAGERESQQYEDLSKKADEYQKSIDEVNGTMKALSGNTGLNALVQTLGLASGGLAIFQGLTAMTAGENERLDQIMVKLQSTMSIAIGVQQLQNSLQKESGIIQSVMALQTLARARAEALATKNTIASTVAQRIFNTVAKANPYVLLATALVTVVGALVLFSSKTKKAVEDQKALSKATVDGSAESIVSYKKLQVQWNSLGNDLKKKEKFITDNKDEFKKLGVEVENVSDAENLLIKQSDAFIQALMLRAKATAEYELAVEKYKQSVNEKNEEDQKDKDWDNAGFFGKAGMMISASFTNYDGNKSKKSAKEAEDLIKKSVKTQKEAADEIEKAKIKIVATPPSKGSEDFYKAEIVKLEKLKAAALVGSSEWLKYKAQIEKYQDLINPKKAKTTKTAKKTADEFLPPGSVGEISKRLSEIDKALSKATGEKEISTLKAKRISTAKELAEAEKKIQILGLRDQFDESQNLWTAYYSTVETLGQNVADNIYKDLLKNDSSQFDGLVKLQEDLTTKSTNGLITEEEKDVLLEVSQIISQMLGNQSQLDVFKQKVNDVLSSFTNDVERLQYLSDLDKTANPNNGEKAFVAETKRSEIDKQKEIYQSFLVEHRAFEEQKIIITQKYDELRQRILTDKKLTPEQRSNALAKAGEAEAEEFTNAFINKLVTDPKYRQAFANLEAQTIPKIRELRAKLVLELQNLVLSGKGTPEGIAKLRQEIETLNGVIAQKNPFQRISELLDEIQNKSFSTQEKLKKLGELGGIMQGLSGQFTGAVNDIEGMMSDMGISLDNSFGDALDKMKGVLEGIGQMGEGLAMMAKGDPVSIITGGIKAVGGIVKSVSSLFNNDRKKERNIKQWSAAVEELKQKYEDLQRAVNKALGEDTYKQQQTQIANLQAQQAYLQKMINEEGNKKKGDSGKIQDWRNQINAINGQIDDIYTNIAQQISGTNAKDLATQLADALVEAYGKGEDAATAYGKVADDVMKNAVKNALKMQLLEKPMQNIIQQLIKNMGFDANGNGSFDGLTDAEREEIKQMMSSASNNYMQALGAYSDLFGEAAVNANSLEGAVKGVTEETASVIAGQMNAIRIMQGEALATNRASQEIFRNQLLQLTQIEINTRYLKGIFTIMNSQKSTDLRANGLI